MDAFSIEWVSKAKVENALLKANLALAEETLALSKYEILVSSDNDGIIVEGTSGVHHTRQLVSRSVLTLSSGQALLNCIPIVESILNKFC